MLTKNHLCSGLLQCGKDADRTATHGKPLDTPRDGFNPIGQPPYSRIVGLGRVGSANSAARPCHPVQFQCAFFGIIQGAQAVG